jgi:hypothetical protein
MWLQLKVWQGSGIRIGLDSWIRIRIEIKSWIRIRTGTNAVAFIVEFCRTSGQGGGAVRTEGRGGRPGGGGHGSAAGNPGHTYRIPSWHIRIRIRFSTDPDPGFGCWFFTHPESRIQESKRHRILDPGSATLIYQERICTNVYSIRRI